MEAKWQPQQLKINDSAIHEACLLYYPLQWLCQAVSTLHIKLATAIT